MLREEEDRNYNDSSKLEFAKGHRGLMVLTITLMGYILIWAEIFAKIEGWHYMDAVYWADVTLLTVGFGILHQTHLGRSLLIPFAAFGILLLGSVIYRITRVVFDRGRSMWELRLRDEERRKRVRKRERQRTRSKDITNERETQGRSPEWKRKPRAEAFEIRSDSCEERRGTRGETAGFRVDERSSSTYFQEATQILCFDMGLAHNDLVDRWGSGFLWNRER